MRRNLKMNLCLTALLSLTVLETAAAQRGPRFLPGDLGEEVSSRERVTPAESIGDQEDVEIAAGGTGYLVVWTDMRTSVSTYHGFGDGQSGRDVYAARLDASGELIDTTPIVVSQEFGSQQQPEVAWNGQSWLVIWENQTPSETGGAPPHKIFGARVSPDGELLDDPPFEILEAPDYAGSMVQMAVAANGSDWLAVGQADSGGGILGARVAADGTVLDPEPVVLVAGLWFLYSDVTLHTAAGEYLLVSDESEFGFRARRFTPDLQQIGSPIDLPGPEARVASNGSHYFVTWDPSGGVLYGSRMTVDGRLLDPSGIPIMESLWDEGNDSHVDWDGSRWWVFHELPYPDGGLHFARVAPDGTVIDSPPIFVFETGPGSFVGPYTIAGGLAGGVELVWADQGCGECPDEWGVGIDPWDIRGEQIAADATLGADVTISSAAPAQTLPSLASGANEFLAVYVSESDDVQRIMARRLDNTGAPMDPEPIEIAAGTYVTNPAAAWNGSVYLIVWDEFYYCVGGDWPPCGSFIEAVRMLPDGTVIDDEPIRVLEAEHGDVAALGDNFLVVGRDNYIFHEHEVVPLAMRVDGVTGELLDSEPLVVGWSFAVYPRVTTFMGRWLVVFERRASHDENWGGSYYNFVSASGALQYDKFDTPSACGGAEPEVAVSAEAALVVCREGAPNHFLNDVYGGLISADGSPTLDLLISGAVEQQRGPTVAFDGSKFIALWEDTRNAEEYFDVRTDLYAARISVDGAVLDPEGVGVLVQAVPEQHPALISAGGDTLLVASIFRDDPGFTSYRLAVARVARLFTDPPDAWFDGAPVAGCSPLAVDFSDRSVGDVTSWHWDLGDGTISSERNPSHTYDAPGIYSVTMTATGALGGFDTAARFDYITSAAPAQATFTASPRQVCAPIGEVAFTDLSDGFPDSWLWEFGDGTTSTEQNPTHAYASPGVYSVTLTVSGSCGSDARTAIDLIQVDPPCDQVSLALSDIPVIGMLISGDYSSTHVYDVDDFELFYEEMVDDGEGYYSKLEHRWDFDVVPGDQVTFHANTYMFEPDDVDGFRFEYSTDGNIWVPLVDLPVEYGTLEAPLPPTLSGTVYIRLVDTDRTPGNYPTDGVSVDFMSINSFVPLPPS